MRTLLAGCQSCRWGAGPELWQDTAGREGQAQGTAALGLCRGSTRGSRCSTGKSDLIWKKLSPWGETAGDGPRQAVEWLFLEMLKTQLSMTLSKMIWLGLFWCCIFWSTFTILPERKIANENWQPDWKHYLGPHRRLGLLDFKFCVVVLKKEMTKLPFLIKIKFEPILNAFSILFFFIDFLLNKFWHLCL